MKAQTLPTPATREPYTPPLWFTYACISAGIAAVWAILPLLAWGVIVAGAIFLAAFVLAFVFLSIARTKN